MNQLYQWFYLMNQDQLKDVYSLKDLLINCGDEEIQGLIYYFSQELNKNDDELNNEEFKKINIDEKQLKEKVINKIYKILPQDIISILQDNNIIKKKITNQKNFVILKIIQKMKKIKNIKFLLYTLIPVYLIQLKA